MAEGEELPPVIAVIQAQIRDLVAGLKEARDMLAAFERDAKAEADIGANTAPAMTKLTGLEEAIAAYAEEHPEATLDVNTAPAMLKIAEVKAALDSVSGTAVASAMPRWASAMAGGLGWDASVGRWRVATGPGRGGFASLAAIKAMQASMTAEQRSSLPADALAALAGAGAGRVGAGGGGGGGGLGASLMGFLPALLWGKGMAGMAGMGTLGSFAGLGPEHLLMTGVGLAGSMAGGALGAGLLGLGSLGVMGVGMGTNMAGMGQASNDIKMVVQAQNALNQAIAVYGQNSAQAAAAQAQLNYDLKSFSPVARSAVLAAADTAQQFEAMFDKFTGLAEKRGAQILQQIMQVGEKFLPTIGAYAAANMAILKKALQPLFSWLTDSSVNGGMGIFTHLENLFTQNLPTGVHMLTQGFELFAKTVNVAASYTGPFLHTLDRFFTKYNNGAGFARWEAEIGKLIGDFRMWEGFVKALVTDIYRLFHNDAGTASGIVHYLTQMLQKLGQWESSTKGSATLHNIFTVHKQEILALLKLLPPLVSSFGHIYMTVAPALTKALNAVLRAIVPLLNALAKNPAGAWVLGLTLIMAKLGAFKAVLGPLTASAIAPFTAKLKTMGDSLGTWAAGLVGIAPKAKAAAPAIEEVGKAAATAAEDAAAAPSAMEGVAGGLEGIGSALGPAGLIAGGIIGLGTAIGVLIAKANNGRIFHQIADGVAAMNQQINQMPTNSVLQIGVDIDKLTSSLSRFNKQLAELKPGTKAFNETAGKAQAAQTGLLNLTQQQAILSANTASLSKQFDVSAQTISDAAGMIGINLNQKLDPQQVYLLGQQISQLGVQFNNAAASTKTGAAQVAKNVGQMVTDTLNSNTTLSSGLQEAMNLDAIIMGKGSAVAVARFVNAQKGGLPEVLGVAKQFGVTIPNAQLKLLEKNMGSAGKVSVQQLAQGIADQTPVIYSRWGTIEYGMTQRANVLKQLLANTGTDGGAALARGLAAMGPQVAAAAQLAADGVKGPLNQLVSEAMNIGENLDSGFAQGISNGVPWVTGEAAKMAGAAARAAQATLNSHSPSRVGIEIGQSFAQGFALGISGHTPLAVAAAAKMASASARALVGSSHASSMALAGAPGTALGAASTGAVVGSPGTTVANHIEVIAQTNASAQQIAAEVGIELRHALGGR